MLGSARACVCVCKFGFSERSENDIFFVLSVESNTRSPTLLLSCVYQMWMSSSFTHPYEIRETRIWRFVVEWMHWTTKHVPMRDIWKSQWKKKSIAETHWAKCMHTVYTIDAMSANQLEFETGKNQPSSKEASQQKKSRSVVIDITMNQNKWIKNSK